MNSIECQILKVRAKSGAMIDDCIKECIVLSMQKGHDVELIHNERSIMINWGSLLNKVYQDNEKTFSDEQPK